MDLPWGLLRAMRGMGRVLGQLGFTPVSLEQGSLIAAAQVRTGLTDLGDEEFREPLHILLRSLEREAHLSLPGRITAHSECIRLLENRLRIHDLLRRHPEIVEQQVRRPIIIVGLPRTGTSLLHHLLAQDPGARIPYAWELRRPVPPQPREDDTRIRESERAVRRLLRVAPVLKSQHPYDPRGPEECNFLLMHSFQSFFFHLLFDVPGYLRWALQADWTAAYRFYRTQLQLLQWSRPGHPWVLKCPSHLLCLDALLTVFPDACLVQTHRDPRRVVASFASMAFAVRSLTTERVPDPHAIGETSMSLLGMSVDRAVEVRDAADPGRVVDVSYARLMADPLATVGDIYEHFGFAVTPEMREGMRRWLVENPPARHGPHLYRLEQFGLGPQSVQERFSGYSERFRPFLEGGG